MLKLSISTKLNEDEDLTCSSIYEKGLDAKEILSAIEDSFSAMSLRFAKVSSKNVEERKKALGLFKGFIAKNGFQIHLGLLTPAEQVKLLNKNKMSKSNSITKICPNSK